MSEQKINHQAIDLPAQEVMEALNHLRTGIAIFDEQDLLVYCNEHFRYVYCSLEDISEIRGWTYEETLRLLVKNGEFAGKKVVMDPEGWIAERMNRHSLDYSVTTERLSNGSWLQIKERQIAGRRTICLWSDATENNRYIARLEGAMECIADGFAVWDQIGRLIMFNDKFAERFCGLGMPLFEGVLRKDVFQQLSNSDRLVLPGSADDWVAEMQNRQHLASSKIEIEYKDDSHFILSERRSSEGGIVSALTDITELKRKERELVYRGISLEHAVSELEMVNDSLERQGEDLVGMAEQIDANHTELQARDRALAVVEARQRAILNTMADALVVLDKKGSIEVLNPVAESLIGLDLRKVAGHPLGEFIQIEIDNELVGDIPAFFSAIREEAGGIADKFQELVIRRQDKTLLHAEVGIAEAMDGDDRFYVITMRDISDRKEAEKKLTESHEQLENRVKERTVELTWEIEQHELTESDLLEAKLEAENANWAKSQFLANMSHELRTPLNGIIGFSNIMKDEMFGPIGNDKYRDYSKDIEASGTHLLGLINDILDVSKIELDALVLNDDTIDLNEVVDICIAMVAEHASDRQVGLQFDKNLELPNLKGDERRIKQIVINLLTNAIKFTDSDGFVDVSTRLTKNGSLELIVSDTGSGISKEDINRVLLPFTQVADSHTRNHGGTGLGLSICQSLVKAHGGALKLVSELGVGTQVVVLFPSNRVLSAG